MSVTPMIHEQQAAGQPLVIVERFLRDRESVWQQVKLEYRLDELIRQMLITSAIGLGGYGAVVGMFHSPWQALASALKLPLVFLLTLAICLPMLYLYNLLFGGRLSAQQLLALVLAAITVTGVFAFSLAPIVLFLLITAHSYLFFNLLNVTVLGLSATVGIYFLIVGVGIINGIAAREQAAEWGADDDSRPALSTGRTRPVSSSLLVIWLVVYGFVGTQLGWTLRPFIGTPEAEFVLFRSVEGSFYNSVFYSLINLVR